MFKIGILTDKIEKDAHSAELFEKASYRADAYLVQPKELSVEITKDSPKISAGHIDLHDLDALIVRRLDQSLDSDLQFDLLLQLHQAGVLLVNPFSSLQICESKALTTNLLAMYGLPTIESLATQDLSRALDFADRFDDIVIKPLYGHLGIDVFRLSELEDFKSKVVQMIKKYGSVFLQRFIDSGGRDNRVFVVDDRECGSIERQTDTGWKTNVFQGAKARKKVLDKELRNMAVKASQIIGLDYSGVDLISENGKTYILELNGSPAWEGLKKATKKDIASEIISAVLKKLQNYRKTGQFISS